jgi:hypothetical protein
MIDARAFIGEFLLLMAIGAVIGGTAIGFLWWVFS